MGGETQKVLDLGISMFRGVDLICSNAKPSQQKLMAVRIIFSKYRVLSSTENCSCHLKLSPQISLQCGQI